MMMSEVPMPLFPRMMKGDDDGGDDDDNDDDDDKRKRRRRRRTTVISPDAGQIRTHKDVSGEFSHS